MVLYIVCDGGGLWLGIYSILNSAREGEEQYKERSLATERAVWGWIEQRKWKWARVEGAFLALTYRRPATSSGTASHSIGGGDSAQRGS